MYIGSESIYRTKTVPIDDVIFDIECVKESFIFDVECVKESFDTGWSVVTIKFRGADLDWTDFLANNANELYCKIENLALDQCEEEE